MEGLMLVLALAVMYAGGPQGAPGVEARTPEQLADCPGKPNCVSSEAGDVKHVVEPLHLKGDPAAAWKGIRAIVTRLPRSEVVRSADRYFHVIFKSRIFGFVDDLELLWDPGKNSVAIRSASRTGYSDLGVNRRRVQRLREAFRDKGLIE